MTKKKLSYICIFLIALIFILITANIWASSNWLTVNHYEVVSDKANAEVRLVVLSDLHNHEFGKENQKLIETVSEQSPDLILLDGDFLNEDSEDAKVVCGLVEEMREIAPVYFALGNHEKVYMENKDADLIEELESAGAVVLDEEYIDLEIEGTAVRLGGMYDYAFRFHPKTGEIENWKISGEEGEFLREFQNTESLKIMMSHRPDSFVFGNAASYWNIDLVVSGHNHGGQVVVPFLGGVYGGDQGIFPKYVHGMYQQDEAAVFVTSGLGSDKQILPRINNLPEVAVVKILQK